MKKEIAKQSIMLMGPVGAGKSLLSQNLKKRTGKLAITLDIMRHCPKDVKVIEAEKAEAENRVVVIRKMLGEEKDPRRVAELERQLARTENLIWVCDTRIPIRKALPKLPNYEELGYNEKISREIQDRAGELGLNRSVAWHYYQKRFENELLGSLVEQLEVPAIIDLGGGVPICLTKDYQIIYKKAVEMGFDIEEYMPKPEVLEKQTNEVFGAFPKENIFYLELPRDYKKTMEKAGHEPLNDTFIGTGQYQERAGEIIKVGEMIEGKTINQDAVDRNCAHIIETTLSQGQVQ